MIVVVTVTYNPMKDGILEPFLRCMREQRGADMLLYIVDNASSDGTAERLQAIDDPGTVIQLNECNRGFAAACNQGIEFARSVGANKILFLNNDTEFGDMMVAELAESLKRSGADAISPLIVYFDAPSRIWYAGGHFSKVRGYLGVHDHVNGDVRHAPAALLDTRLAPGCCLMMTMKLLDEIGVWDERYFVYLEDTDISLRISEAGKRIVLDPKVVLYHKASTSTGGKFSDFTIVHFNRNHILMLRKHFGSVALIYTLAVISMKSLANLLLGRLNLRQLKLKVGALADGLRLAREHGD